jgi:TonB family protein
VGTETAFGRYEVVEELGAGASGVVYLCVDPELTRPVAVKVLRPPPGAPASARDEYMARFQREAEAAGRLRHPGIVQVFDVGPDWLVMEYVEGRTLAHRLEKEGPLPAALVIRMVDEVAAALQFAHDHGIVHRDVKPANLMLDAEGGAKVMDFGIARVEASTLTSAGSVVGSIRYMSPEQMLGQTVDRRSDVFSLGAVAYEALTGRPPFSGRTVTEVVANVVHGRHVPPRSVDARLSAAVDKVFARVFAVDPAGRHPTAPDFARELEAALVSGTLAAGELVHDTTLVVAPTDTIVESEEEVQAAALLPAVLRDRVPVRSGGVLMVHTDPPGAVIEIDGEEAGTTPGTLPVPFGRHLLRLRRPGRQAVTQEVEVWPASALRMLSAALPPAEDGDELQPGQFVPFGPGVTAPRRLAGEAPAYPKAAEKRRLAGAPVVEAFVAHTGEVDDVTVVESAGAVLDKALVKAVQGWRFEPATVRGVPVSTRLTIQHVVKP